jgi:hypothetical protein
MTINACRPRNGCVGPIEPDGESIEGVDDATAGVHRGGAAQDDRVPIFIEEYVSRPGDGSRDGYDGGTLPRSRPPRGSQGAQTYQTELAHCV